MKGEKHIGTTKKDQTHKDAEGTCKTEKQNRENKRQKQERRERREVRTDEEHGDDR